MKFFQTLVSGMALFGCLQLNGQTSRLFLTQTSKSFNSPIIENEKDNSPANLSKPHIGVGWVPVYSFKPTTSDFSLNNMFRLSLGINYLSGVINANIQFAKLEGNAGIPDCIMFDNSLGYQIQIPARSSFKGIIGLQIGLNTIKFDLNSYAKDQEIETELSAGIEFGLLKTWYDKYGLQASAKFIQIFSNPKYEIGSFDIGFVYFFNSSDKIKKWLD